MKIAERQIVRALDCISTCTRFDKCMNDWIHSLMPFQSKNRLNEYNKYKVLSLIKLAKSWKYNKTILNEWNSHHSWLVFGLSFVLKGLFFKIFAENLLIGLMDSLFFFKCKCFSDLLIVIKKVHCAILRQ